MTNTAPTDTMDTRLFLRLHRLTATGVFFAALVVLTITATPTVSFWDSGEFITAAVTLGIPHPPGAPLFVLLGRIFSMSPFGADMAFRVTMLSVVASALVVLFSHLIMMRLLRAWNGAVVGGGRAVGMLVAAASGALMLAFSETFWANGTETEMYNLGLMFMSASMWITLEWYTRSGRFASWTSLLLVAYLVGLSIGVHLLAVLVLVFVLPLVVLRDAQVLHARAALLSIGLTVAGLLVVYPGIVKWLPGLLAGGVTQVLAILVLAGIVVAALHRKLAPHWRLAALAILCVTLGYSTFVTVMIRAADRPVLAGNDPSDFAGLYGYVNRDLYGNYPLLQGANYNDATHAVDGGSASFLPRRWNPASEEAYRKYSSDMEYFLQYQLGHMYLRYLMWNTVGRAGDTKDDPAVFFGEAAQPVERGYPNTLYFLPLLLAVIGLILHARRDVRTWSAFLLSFLVTGPGLVVYFNTAEPQLIELDYFFVASFHIVFLWAGLGVFLAGEWIAARVKSAAAALPVSLALGVLGPVVMFTANVDTHDRRDNLVPFDYACNLLQSCAKNAILITTGDNDLFPLLYVQQVAGVRRDVRVVSNAWLKTAWYARHLRDVTPGGSLPVKLSFADAELEAMQPQPVPDGRLQVDIPMRGADWGDMVQAASLADGFAAIAGRDTISMTVQLEPTMQGRFELEKQDRLLVDLIRENAATHPIHFTIGQTPREYVGLLPWLAATGFTYRLMPFPTVSHRRYLGMADVGAMRRHMQALRNEPALAPEPGFLFRGMARPDVTLDAIAREIHDKNYWFIWMATALYAVEMEKDTAFVRDLIDRITTAVPNATPRFTMPVMPDVAMLYTIAGRRDKADAVVAGIEREYLPRFEADPAASVRSAGGPSVFQVLLRTYDVTGQYAKALAFVERYRTLSGDDKVLPIIERYRHQATGGAGG